MIKVNNKKAILNLAKKSFWASKTRNLVAVIAIVLTTVLFTGLFTVGVGMMESIQRQTVRQAGGDGHIALKYLTEAQYQAVKDHPLIDKISYNKTIADSVTNAAFLKRPVELYYMDETAMELGFCAPTTGTAPRAEKELAADTLTLELLGVPAKVGAVVPLDYTIRGTAYHTDFVLSGFWESDPSMPVGYALVSEAFTQVNAEILSYQGADGDMMSGSINAYIMCKNSFQLEEKMWRIVTESGYTLDDGNQNTPPLASDIYANTNWAYLAGTMDAESATGGMAALLLFALAGYLIIYNVFQISVQRDIRFYGLLKTIGTTGRQLRRIIRRQALWLSLSGVPIGLILGYLVGKTILPRMMDLSNYGGKALVSPHPVIFIAAALFSAATVFISTRKPARIAAAVSPVEAAKYSGGSGRGRREKRSQDGGKLWRMAFSNLARNRRRTVITVLSLSLALVVLNTVFTVTQSFDMDKYVSNFVDTDYLVGHANYFGQSHFRMPEDGTSQQIIEAIRAQEGFLEGGRLYKNIYLGQCSIERENPAEPNRYHTNLAEDGMPILDLYGLDALPLSRLDIVEGELDLEKLATGKYIIEGLGADDDGSIYPETSHYEIGDLVTIHVDGAQYQYELLAKTRVKFYTNTDRIGSNYTMYLPSEAYLQIVTRPLVMTYAFNVTGDGQSMEDFLQGYTEQVEPLMSFSSKANYVAEFISTKNLFAIVGGFLSAMIGGIGLLNFVNSILTGIITRKREFATLQSIGMTRGQLIRMLMFEGGYYALLTAVCSLAVGALFSVAVVGTMVSRLWFFSYQFTLLPLFIICPVLLVLGLLIPWLVYCGAGRQSLVEQLRVVE